MLSRRLYGSSTLLSWPNLLLAQPIVITASVHAMQDVYMYMLAIAYSNQSCYVRQNCQLPEGVGAHRVD